MGLLKNLLEFYKKNKKNIFYVLLFVVIFFHGTDLSFAGGGGGTVGVNTPPEKSKLENTVINFINGVLGIFSMVIGFITLIVGLFLRPEWTSGSVIGLDTQLKTMWILISNFVYFIFAGIFIFIAFMNIVGDADHYGLKKAIPKFIVGVLIVPFSWFFVQLILSLSGVLTAAVLSLPYDTFPTLDIQKKELNLCKDGTELNLSKTGSSMFSCKGGSDKVPTKIGDFIKSNDNGGLYQIMVIYSYGVMRLDEKGKVSGKDIGEKGGITTLEGLSLQFIFDIIFIVVYGLLLVALFLAFITRGFALWLYAMFSPFFGLLYYLGKAGEGIGEGAMKNFNLKEFIGLAMVPVYVAGALSFGLLFLYVAGQGFSGADKTGLVKMDQDSLVIGSGSSTTTLKANAIKSSAKSTPSDLFAGFGGPIGAMFLEMLGLAILWMAVMAALHQSKITDSVTHPIAEFGNHIGDLIKKAPTYAPIPGLGVSSQGLAQMGGQAKTFFQDKDSKATRQWMKEKNLFQSEDADKNAAADSALRRLNNGPLDSHNYKIAMDAIKSYDNVRDIKENDSAKNLIKTLADKVGVKDVNIDSTTGIAKAIADINNKAKDEKRLHNDKQLLTDESSVNAILGKKGGGNSSEDTKVLPNTVEKNQSKSKEGGEQVFNIYGKKSDGTIDTSKTEHTIIVDKDGKTKVDDAIKSLQGFKGTYNLSDTDKFENEVLESMGIKGESKYDIMKKLRGQVGFFKISDDKKS